MSKTIIYLLMLLCLIGFVSAGTVCISEQPCTIYGVCKNITFIESTAKTTIYYPNTTLFEANRTMTEISTGRFNYTFIAPEIIGNYLQVIQCNISNFIGVGQDEFTIGENKLISDSITDFVNLGIVVLFFLIHLALVFFGLRNRITVFVFIGGIFGVIAGLVGLALLTSSIGTIGVAFLVSYTVVSAGFMLFFIPKDD